MELAIALAVMGTVALIINYIITHPKKKFISFSRSHNIVPFAIRVSNEYPPCDM